MLKRIVFNQFHDLVRRGKSPMYARINAVLLLSVLIILPLLVVFFLNSYRFSDRFAGLTASGLSPRFAGWLAGIALLGSIFGIIYLLCGRRSRIERYWEEYLRLDESQRRTEARKGSLELPRFPLAVAARLLEERTGKSDTAVIKEFIRAIKPRRRK